MLLNIQKPSAQTDSILTFERELKVASYIDVLKIGKGSKPLCYAWSYTMEDELTYENENKQVPLTGAAKLRRLLKM